MGLTSFIFAFPSTSGQTRKAELCVAAAVLQSKSGEELNLRFVYCMWRMYVPFGNAESKHVLHI
jgi:hypothetical protein